MSIYNTTYQYHNGVGTSGMDATLPQQTVPKSRKTKQFFEQTLDSLEQIGLEQLYRNLEFKDYYSMTEGRLVKVDFMQDNDDFRSLRDIGRVMNEVELPTYIKHYDILGMIANQLVGELPDMRDAIAITSIDEYSKNDYIRQKEQMVMQYVQQMFNNQLNRMLAMKGINPVKENFQSEEEQQAYLQFLDQEKAKIINPQEIEDEMRKSWKLRAVKWAEQTYEADMERFDIENFEESEMRDFLLTGRFFTHFHIGEDFYEPERWDPIQTFVSENLNIENPQDGEYVGKVDFMSASQIIEKYRNKLSKSVTEELSKIHDNYRDATPGVGKRESLYKRPVQGTIVPDEGFFDREILLQYQSAFNLPLGEAQIENEDGSVTAMPTWLDDYNNSDIYVSSELAREIRRDIRVRSDLFRVTEAYWRGYNLYYIIRYETEDGIVIEDLVEEDLLNEFIRENNIKKLSTVTPEEFKKETERVNQICQTYIPTVYRGKKISGTLGSEEIYFDIEEMEFQIRRNSDYDAKLPVAGIISNSLAQKIRAYQLGYNICLNQITKLLEKELGMFFIMDINLLPSEFKDEGDTKEMLANLSQTIKDIGLLPVDMRKQNTQEPGNMTNTLVKQEVSFSEQIQNRISLAEYYKRLAFEQIGITEQRKGTPNEYMTNEGIKVGQEASFAQTKNLFTKFNSARRKKTEMHLTVAQYCVKNYRDISVYYRNSDGENIYNTFSDDKFHLRKFGVLPTTSSKKKKELESLKQVLLNDNTAGKSILDFAMIMQSDNFTSLIEYARKVAMKQDQDTMLQRQHEQQLLDKELESQERKDIRDKAFEKQLNDDNNKTKILVERLESLGRLSNADTNEADIAAVNKATENSLKEMEIESKNDIENRKLDIKEKETAQTISLKAKEINNQLKELKLKEKELDTKKFTSIINKN